MEIRITLLLWISTFSKIYGLINRDTLKGVDIGYKCKYDAECTAGNGGEYSKCNQVVSVCICTINHLGEDKCTKDSDQYYGVCRRLTLYDKAGQCTLECSPKGTRTWGENEDWYGEIQEHFATFIHDKKTSVCYDPRRAFNSLPDGFEIKQSTLPNAGLGIFTNVYIEQDTILGPYKGVFEPDTDTAVISGYSWKIEPRQGDERSDVVWVDAKDVTLSNWIRYSNTPITASMENLVAVQYRDEIYYQAFKYIEPGTELLVWYGESYGEFLEIEKFEPPRYYYAKPGYVGGACHEDDEGTSCQHDDNTVCADKTCLCVPGTHIRAGKCITDETLGGICTSSDGISCKLDTNAECQRGVCVCKNNTTPANGMCLRDETFGGLCVGKNGAKCLLDNNAICVNGLCRCRYGTTGINGKCLKDEEYKGRCAGEDGEDCEEDWNAECIEKICVCKIGASLVNGKCEFDEMVGGKCQNVDDKTCALDKNAECIEGYCRCKARTSNVNGTCRVDGSLSGVCKEGKCNGQNVVCNSESNTCVCGPRHVSYAGKCVKEQNLRRNK